MKRKEKEKCKERLRSRSVEVGDVNGWQTDASKCAPEELALAENHPKLTSMEEVVDRMLEEEIGNTQQEFQDS